MSRFAHFREILEEDTGLHYSYTAIRKILIASGHKSPKTRRTKKQKIPTSPAPGGNISAKCYRPMPAPLIGREPGNPPPFTGLLMMLPALSPAFIMEKNECLLGYLEVIRQTIERYGIPSELYPDKAGVFL